MESRIVLLIVFAVVVLASYFAIYFRRARTLLNHWLKKHGYELLKAELRLFRRGPYMFSGRGHAVYRVEILDDYGAKRKGWVRCGGWIRGVFADQVEGTLDNLKGDY